MQAKWQVVHGPRAFSWKELAASIVDIAGRSDWQSPLYAAFAPLALYDRCAGWRGSSGPSPPISS